MSPYDLSGQVIKISTRLNTFYEYDATVENVSVEDPENGSLSVEYRLSQGYSVEIFLSLQLLLNFTYVINPNVDIYDLKNSISNDVDLYLASFSLHKERALYADPTVVIGYSSVVALINHEFEDASTDVLVKTFSFNLLCLVLVFIFSFLVILAVLTRRCPQVSLVESQIQGLAIILRQDGFKKFPANASSRIVLLVLSVFGILVSASFTGNMISMSAINGDEIDSVEELLESDFQILLELGAPNSTIRLMLNHMLEIPKVGELMSRIRTSEQTHKYKDISKYIQLVKTSPTAYIMDLESAVAEVHKDVGYMPCSWGTFPVYDLWYPWVMFMKKGSTHRPAINFGIMKLRETGVMARIRWKVLPKEDKCKQENQSFVSIKISHVKLAYIAIILGFCSAIVILIVEKSVERRRLKQKAWHFLLLFG